MTSTVYNPADFPSNQFGAAAGSGVHESENYAVAYASSYFGPTQVEVLNNPEGDVVKGCYVTNTAWVKYVTEQGTGMNSSGKEDANLPFTIGDYYKIIATGDNGNSAEFYLVDYRNSHQGQRQHEEASEGTDPSSCQALCKRIDGRGQRR